MEDVNLLLTDKYVEFARRIVELLNQKKLIEEELNQNRGEYNALVTALWSLRTQAAKAQEEFEAWKKECLSNCGDG